MSKIFNLFFLFIVLNDSTFAQSEYHLKLYVVPFYYKYSRPLHHQKIKRNAVIKIMYNGTPWECSINSFFDSLNNSFNNYKDSIQPIYGDYRVFIIIRKKYVFWKCTKIWGDPYGNLLYRKRKFYNSYCSNLILELIPETIKRFY